MSLTEITAIDENYPVAGIDQSSQTFRDNFANIKVALTDLDLTVVTVIDDLGDVDTTSGAPITDDVLVFDGVNWVPGVANVVLDVTPQLGGNLDANGFNITDGSSVLLGLSGVTSSVNWLTVTNAITTESPKLSAVGIDANVNMLLSTKGTGSVILSSGAGDARMAAIAGSNLEIATEDNVSGNAPNITISAGSGTGAGGDGGSINLIHGAKDTTGTAGLISMRDQDSNVIALFKGTTAGTSVNFFSFTNAITGVNPTIQVGGETNVDMGLVPKGTGNVFISGLSYPNADGTAGQSLTTDGSGTLGFASRLGNVVDDGSPQLGANLDANSFDIEEDGNVIVSFTSGGELAVNWIDVKHAVTGVGPTIASVGGDANIDLNLTAKGAGIVNIGSGGIKFNAPLDTGGQNFMVGGEVVLSFSTGGETAVNWVDIQNSITSVEPKVKAVGANTNVDLGLVPKGTGNVLISSISYPNTDGSSGDVLTTDGSGTVGFAAPLVADPTIWPYRVDPSPGPVILSGDGVVIVTLAGSPVIALPPAGAVPTGKQIKLKNGGGATVGTTIAPSGGDSIDAVLGPNAALLSPPFATTTLVSDGVSAWFAV